MHGQRTKRGRVWDAQLRMERTIYFFAAAVTGGATSKVMGADE